MINNTIVALDVHKKFPTEEFAFYSLIPAFPHFPCEALHSHQEPHLMPSCAQTDYSIRH